MKTLQNTIAIVALATLLFSTNILAQDQASSNATVSIHLAKGLSISPIDQSIDFPEYVAAGNGGGTTTVVPGNARGASFKVNGEAGKSVSVDYDATVLLSNGTDNLTFTADVDETGDNSSYSGASSVADGGSVALDGTTGNVYLWIGGSITIAAQSAGTYTGTFNFTVAY